MVWRLSAARYLLGRVAADVSWQIGPQTRHQKEPQVRLRVVSYVESGMIKSDLVWRIRHQSAHLRLQDAEKIVDAIFDEIIASLARGKRVELRGFGTFSIKVHKARIGRNPRTGAQVPVPKKAHPHFWTGKEMKERLNRS